VKRRALWLLGATVLVLALLAWHFQRPTAVPVHTLACPDVLAGCSNAEGNVHVSFGQAPRIMQPFDLFVAAPGADALFASFDMQGMQMGLNRYRLLPGPDGRWTAEVVLPVCVQGRSDWQLLLEIHEAGSVRRVQARKLRAACSRRRHPASAG